MLVRSVLPPRYACLLALISLDGRLLRPARSPRRPRRKLRSAARCRASRAQLTEISGMKLRHPVPCDFHHQGKDQRVSEEAREGSRHPEEIRAEELTLKKFGLVPQDFDLAKNTVDLLTEQAAAFYDYDRKKLFITDSTPRETQEPVLAHELSHALADQNFNLAQLHQAGPQERRRLHGAPGGDGRPGHLADVRIPGAQDGPLAADSPELAAP